MSGQTHNTWTRSLTMNGHITQSSCQVKPTTHGQEVSLWMDTSPSHHVRTDPQHMDKKSHYEWTHHPVIMSGQAHNTWTRSFTMNGHITQSSCQDTPTTHGQEVSLMGTDTTSPARDDGIKYHPTQTMAAWATTRMRKVYISQNTEIVVQNNTLHQQLNYQEFVIVQIT